MTPLFAAVAACEIHGEFRLALQRTSRRADRTALVSVRFITQLWLHLLEHLSQLPSIAVTAILAEEMQSPSKETRSDGLCQTPL